MLAAAVQRLRIYERSGALQEREHHGENRGHAGIEDRGGVGAALERYQLLLEDFSVWMIQPRINQVRTIVTERPDFPKHDPERALSRLRTRKHEGRAAIDRRPRRSDRQLRVEAAGQHRGLGPHAIRNLRHQRFSLWPLLTETSQ